MAFSEIILATGNQHKVREVREILDPFGIQLKVPADFGGLPEVIEDGDTFAANAIKKAAAAAKHTGLPALADDSGIEARALNWRPGVYSARYAGPECDDEKNNYKLIEELADQDDKFVRYCCVIAFVAEGYETQTWTGYFEGEHTADAQGHGGFGYDPYVFVPDAGMTVAQMSSEEKHRRSHRGKALRQFAEYLKNLN